MTTWTAQQITQARGLHAEAGVDVTLFERDRVGMLEDLRYELAKPMQRIAHTFAIEIHPDDLKLQIVDEGDRPPFAVKVQARWEPQTRTIEFVGGWKDGQRFEWRDAPQPLRVPLPPPPLTMSSTMDTYPTSPAAIAETYVCVGWHEQGRRWIYQPDA